ncbi:hypothetical protein KM043_002291 [Ampulex compressa]|nr:hypothetical protein KM043_002291 [Ampulex compressa]
MLKRLRRKERSEKTIILLIVGLDNAGKTLVLNHISGDPDRDVLPTMGFRIVSLKYKSYVVKIYDIGGSTQIRALWPKYYNDIHGLIYVVDASDISRLTENKIVFGELVSHEHISGKPLLLLANKQDVTGAIDEIDVVESLDVEHVANSMRCPTRVETCSCAYDTQQYKNNTMGIKNGYKWLMDTIDKNYNTLHNRTKENQDLESGRVIQKENVLYSPSKVSIHSNPFKPIRELLSQKEEYCDKVNSSNGTHARGKLKIFTNRNKTAPYSSEHSIIMSEAHSTSSVISPLEMQKNLQAGSPILNPSKLLFTSNEIKTSYNRPYTAPSRSQISVNKMIAMNIPGQVTQQ